MSKALARRRSGKLRRRNSTGVNWAYLLGGAAIGATIGGAVGAFQGYQAFNGPLATNEIRTGTASGAMLARGSAYAEFGALGGWALGGIVGGNPIVGVGGAAAAFAALLLIGVAINPSV